MGLSDLAKDISHAANMPIDTNIFDASGLSNLNLAPVNPVAAPVDPNDTKNLGDVMQEEEEKTTSIAPGKYYVVKNL